MTTSNRMWILVVAVVAIAAVVLGWLLGVSPKLDEKRASDLQHTQVDAANQQHLLETAKLKADFANLTTISSQLADLKKQVPSNASYPAFLSELDSIAADHSVEVTSVGFQAPTAVVATTASSTTPAATTPAATAAPVDNTVPAGTTVAIPATLTFTGSFAHLQSAVGALQQGDRLFLVSGLAFTGSGVADSQGKATGDYTVTVTGSLYVLTDSSTLIESAPTPAATPTATPTTAPTAAP